MDSPKPLLDQAQDMVTDLIGFLGKHGLSLSPVGLLEDGHHLEVPDLKIICADCGRAEFVMSEHPSLTGSPPVRIYRCAGCNMIKQASVRRPEPQVTPSRAIRPPKSLFAPNPGNPPPEPEQARDRPPAKPLLREMTTDGLD